MGNLSSNFEKTDLDTILFLMGLEENQSKLSSDKISSEILERLTGSSPLSTGSSASLQEQEDRSILSGRFKSLSDESTPSASSSDDLSEISPVSSPIMTIDEQIASIREKSSALLQKLRQRHEPCSSVTLLNKAQSLLTNLISLPDDGPNTWSEEKQRFLAFYTELVRDLQDPQMQHLPYPSQNLKAVMKELAISWQKAHFEEVLVEASKRNTPISGNIPGLPGVKYFVTPSGEGSIFIAGDTLTEGGAKKVKKLAHESLVGVTPTLVRFSSLQSKSMTDAMMMHELKIQERLRATANGPVPSISELQTVTHKSKRGSEKTRYVAERCEGNLHTLMTQAGGSLKAKKEVLSCLVDALETLDVLHQAGLVHQDIKPANILFYRDKVGKLHGKLTDFGSTKERKFNNISTGTLGYTPPMKELLKLSTTIPTGRDMFSVGMSLLHIFQQEIHINFVSEFQQDSEAVSIDPEKLENVRALVAQLAEQTQPGTDSLAKLILDLTGPLEATPTCRETITRLRQILQTME